MRISDAGKKRPFNPKAIEAMRAANLSRQLSDAEIAYRKKRSKAQQKPVEALRGGEKLYFNSIGDAATFVNGASSNISKACRGHIKSAYGFKWKYKD